MASLNPWGRRGAPALQRFWAKISKDGHAFNGVVCWEWLGKVNKAGYGCFSPKRDSVIAHRWSYEQFVGPIPEGLTIDHLCRNRRCVNPAHLEAVTARVNILRGEGIAGDNARKTHCKRGHLLEGWNLLKVPGGRACHQCRNDYARLKEQQKRDRIKEKRHGICA